MNQHFSPSATDAISVAMENDLEAAISRWRLAQHPALPRSEAIYQLLTIALTHEGLLPPQGATTLDKGGDPVARLVAALKSIN